MAMPSSSSSDPMMATIGAAKRVFIAAVDEQLAMAHAAFTNTAIDKSSIKDSGALALESELEDALAELVRKYRTSQSFSLEFERQSRGANECYTEQLAFDQAIELLELAKRVVQCASRLVGSPRSELAAILDCEQPEALLNRLFPVVSCTATYALRFVESRRFMESDSFVKCAKDMSPNGGRFTFVPALDTKATGSNTVSLGTATKYGLQSYVWITKENRFVCESAASTRQHLQSQTWLLPDEEWAALSPFRPLEYARPLRVGDVFLLRSVGKRTNNRQFMTSPTGTDHLVLRHSPSAESYVVALSDVHGRFLCGP